MHIGPFTKNRSSPYKFELLDPTQSLDIHNKVTTIQPPYSLDMTNLYFQRMRPLGE